MRIAVPVANDRISMHFGHCERFAFFDVDHQNGRIVNREEVPAPPHQPGFLPPWMAERKVDLILAGGMGPRAQGLFAQYGIKVITGVPAIDPEEAVHAYLLGTLQTGVNVCDHGHGHGHGHHHCGGSGH
ncbi:MAG: NifB/NifX family molybdenum-iron cluster-binding protein [Thermodesulforhabdaceae bacterium]|jgi:predicted Fe-Mo cluster-binding NifX family protein